MGRLLRISIYAFIILILYIMVTELIDSYAENQKKNAVKEIPETISESQQYSDQDTTYKLSSNEVSDNENQNYTEIDETIENLKETENNTSASKPKAEDKKDRNPSTENNSPKSEIKNTSEKTVADKGAGGNYLVICGSYLLKENAENMIKKLKKQGYTNAKITIFNASGYHSVIAGQYSSQSEAQKTMNSLKKQGIDCLVKIK